MKCPTEKSVADDAAVLRQLALLYPNREALISRLAELKSELTLLKPTIHVISDIHGEFKKLKHIINNASGSLRPLVEELFADKLDAAEKMELLNLVHYPRETYTLMIPRLASFEARRDFIERYIDRAAVVLRAVAQRYSLPSIRARIPERFRLFLEDLLFAPQLNRSQDYVRAALDEFLTHGIELDLIRAVARLIRNLLIAELVIGGDFGDRGPRIDRVIDYVMRQPHVTIVW